MKVKIKLYDLLKNKKVAQRELARLTGMRLASVNDMCQNKILYLHLDGLAKICEVLDCDISDVLELEGKDRQE